jgi:hypothetical protein
VVAGLTHGNGSHDEVKVEVRRSGRRFEAEAVLDLAADPQTVWDTITDYDGLPSFMPGIRACRVIEQRRRAFALAYVFTRTHEPAQLITKISQSVQLGVTHFDRFDQCSALPGYAFWREFKPERSSIPR